MGKHWRPEDWEKTKSLDCNKCAFVDEKPNSDCVFCDRNFEAGADAMLEALRKAGEHHDAKWVDDAFGLHTEIAGTLVFIPDE